MYCPSCDERFGEDVTVCPDCGEALTPGRPGPPPDPTITLTPVFRSGDPGIIALARSLLDAEGIEHQVGGEGVQDLFGGGRLGTGFNLIAGPAIFIVRQEDAARAREVLRGLGEEG